MVKKEDILKNIKSMQLELKSFGVKKIGLFGSYIRNEQKPDSDIDLLVEFEKEKKNFDNFINISTMLEDRLNHHIELVTTDSLSPYIKPYIMKEIEYVHFSH